MFCWGWSCGGGRGRLSHDYTSNSVSEILYQKDVTNREKGRCRVSSRVVGDSVDVGIVSARSPPPYSVLTVIVVIGV